MTITLWCPDRQEKVDKYQDLAREIKRLWKVEARVIPIVIGAFRNDTKRPGGEPEKIGNNHESLIDSESGTPRNSMNTKEGTEAWIVDSDSENAVSEGSQAMRRSPNLSDTNTSIIICCDKMEIVIIIMTLDTTYRTIECVDMINSGCPLAEFLNNLLFV